MNFRIQDKCLDSWDLLLETHVGSVEAIMDTLSKQNALDVDFLHSSVQ